jgi:hypothetical protein
MLNNDTLATAWKCTTYDRRIGCIIRFSQVASDSRTNILQNALWFSSRFQLLRSCFFLHTQIAPVNLHVWRLQPCGEFVQYSPTRHFQ